MYTPLNNIYYIHAAGHRDTQNIERWREKWLRISLYGGIGRDTIRDADIRFKAFFMRNGSKTASRLVYLITLYQLHWSYSVELNVDRE